MTDHLLTDEINSYLKREMKPADLLKTDDHLAQCDACFQKAQDLEKRRGPADFDFLQASPEETEHLRYEQLENYLHEKSDDVEREIADVHLRACAACKAELNGLIEMRNLLEADLQKQILPEKSAEKSISAQLRGFFSGGNFLKIGFATIALLILVSALFLFSKRGPDSTEIAVTPPSPSNLKLPAVSPDVPPANVEINALPNINANLQNKPPVEAKTNEFPPAYQTEIERVLAGNRLNLPAELNELNAQTGKLMGGGSDAVPFALEAPLGKIIQTARPQFRWRALEGATGYVVNVYDANFNRVAGSPQITNTSWRIDRPLAGNKIYIWQVTALKDGQEIKSPVRPAPDAKFKVIDAAKANELARLSREYKNEPLFLGILYANAGLVDEAEREFQKEIAKNPNSKPARKFLQDVRKLK